MYRNRHKKSEQIRKILSEYFSGRLPDPLERSIQRWLAGETDREDKERELRQIFEKLVRYDRHPGRFAYRSLARARKKLGYPVPALRIHGWLYGAGARAAAILAPAVLTGGILLWSTYRTKEELPQKHLTEIEPTARSQRNILLPDGSRIRLAEGSWIGYPEDFLAERTVHLRGEAHFSVRPLEGKPFRIETGHLQVRVLGTEFNLQDHGTDAPAILTLEKGEVEVTAQHKSYRITAGQELTYHTPTEEISIRTLPPEPELLRKQLPLDFPDTPLPEVWQMLSNYYGIRIKTEENLRTDARIQARFGPGTPLEETLFMLQEATGAFDYEIKEDMVIVTRR